jgi:hypothetical protein
MAKADGWSKRLDDPIVLPKQPTTFNIAAEVYQIKKDRRVCSSARS